jgi:hypothetical protein
MDQVLLNTFICMFNQTKAAEDNSGVLLRFRVCFDKYFGCREVKV